MVAPAVQVYVQQAALRPQGPFFDQARAGSDVAPIIAGLLAAQVALFLGLVWALLSNKGLGVRLRGLPKTAGGAFAGELPLQLSCRHLALRLLISDASIVMDSSRVTAALPLAHACSALTQQNAALHGCLPACRQQSLILWQVSQLRDLCPYFVVAALGFHAGLFSILALYLLFWVRLSLLQLIPLLAVAGLVTAVFGYGLLSHLASRAAP